MAVLAVAGLVIGALNALSEGESANSVAKAQGKVLRAQAGQEVAVGTRAMGDQARQARLVSSAAQARLASSGADAADAGSEKIMGDLAAEGEYRALASLYEGQVRGARLRDEANQVEYQGKLGKQASYGRAAATVVSGLGEMYGGGGGASMYSRFKTPSATGGYGAGLGGSNLYTSSFNTGSLPGVRY